MDENRLKALLEKYLSGHCSPATVNSCRICIFQDLYAFYIRRVQTVKRTLTYWIAVIHRGHTISVIT